MGAGRPTFRVNTIGGRSSPTQGPAPVRVIAGVPGLDAERHPGERIDLLPRATLCRNGRADGLFRDGRGFSLRDLRRGSCGDGRGCRTHCRCAGTCQGRAGRSLSGPGGWKSRSCSRTIPCVGICEPLGRGHRIRIEGVPSAQATAQSIGPIGTGRCGDIGPGLCSEGHTIPIIPSDQVAPGVPVGSTDAGCGCFGVLRTGIDPGAAKIHSHFAVTSAHALRYQTGRAGVTGAWPTQPSAWRSCSSSRAFCRGMAPRASPSTSKAHRRCRASRDG